MSEMETKIENPEIETVKELFEYEMTEVLLMLKGEFASISGKDMLKEGEVFVDEAKMKIPEIAIQNQELEPISVSLPEPADINTVYESMNKVNISVQPVQLEVPEAFNNSFIPPVISENAVNIAAPKPIDIPEVKEFSDLTIEKPEIEANPVNIIVSETKIDPVKNIQFSEPQIEPIRLSIPEMTGSVEVNIPKDEVKTLSVSIPDIPAAVEWKAAEIRNREPNEVSQILAPERINIDLSKLNEQAEALNKKASEIRDREQNEASQILTPGRINIDLTKLNEQAEAFSKRAPVEINIPDLQIAGEWTKKETEPVRLKAVQVNSDIHIPDKISPEIPALQTQIPDYKMPDFESLRKMTKYEAKIEKPEIDGLSISSFDYSFTAPAKKSAAKPESVTAAENALAASKTVFTYDDIFDR